MSPFSFVQSIAVLPRYVTTGTHLRQACCPRHNTALLPTHRHSHPSSPSQRRVQHVMTVESSEGSEDSLGLPPLLREYVDAFACVPEPKLRYQQLLFFAKELPVMDSSLKTDDNRVYGCTSVVHVHVGIDNEGRVQLQGDSDSQLTKGLLALLVNGLKGCVPQVVAKIDPQFIAYSGLAASLTPSRNNGFVSMLAKIKQQVSELNQTMRATVVAERSSEKEKGEENVESKSAVAVAEEEDIDPSRPIYSGLIRKLNALKPVSVNVRDDSAKHAGHAGSKGLNGESHFAVSIVADAFEGLTMVKRHRLIYALMSQEMSEGHIHALQIDARTPSEIEN